MRFELTYFDCDYVTDHLNNIDYPVIDKESMFKVVELLNELHEENMMLKKDVEYWKQVANQYNNELLVFKDCEKHKTECKNIHWSSD